MLCVKHPCPAPGGCLAVPVVCPVEGMEVLETGWMVWVTCSPRASTVGRCRMGCHGAELCFHLLRGLLGYFQDSPHPQGGSWCFSSADRDNLVLPTVLEVAKAAGTSVPQLFQQPPAPRGLCCSLEVGEMVLSLLCPPGAPFWVQHRDPKQAGPAPETSWRTLTSHTLAGLPLYLLLSLINEMCFAPHTRWLRWKGQRRPWAINPPRARDVTQG